MPTAIQMMLKDVFRSKDLGATTGTIIRKSTSVAYPGVPLLEVDSEDVVQVSGIGVQVSSLMYDVLASSIPFQPTDGDTLQVGGTAYKIRTADRLSRGHKYRLMLNEGAS